MKTHHAILFLAAQAAFAQTTLTGRVLDPSGAAVPGATVLARSRDASVERKTVADATGAYRFESLSPATHLLTAQARDFASAPAVEVNLSAGPATRDLHLELARVPVRAVVTASATAQSTDETAKAFDLIDDEQLTSRREFSFVEALRNTPGLRVMQLGGPGSLARVHSRGGRAFDTSLVIDGFRFRDIAAPQADATGFLADLLIVDPDRVEVLRGSGSSLYGTHAIGGVVNLVSATGGGPAHGSVLTEGGGLGLFRGVARLAGGLRADRFRYSLGAAHLNVSSGVDGNDPTRNSTAQGSAQWHATARTSFSGRLIANRTFAALNTNPFALASVGTAIPVAAAVGANFQTSLDDPDSRRDSNFTSALLSVTHQASAAVTLRAHYQGLATHRDNRNGPAGPTFQPLFPNNNRFDGRIDTAQARADAALGRRHFVSAGYEFEREDYDNLSTDENPDQARRTRAQVTTAQSSHALFAQEQLRLAGDRLQISLSGRAQRFDLTRPTFLGGAPRYAGVALGTPPNAYTGDVAVAYFIPSTGTKFRAHLGNAYRAPALYERFGYSFFLGSFSPFGDPRIAPERSTAIDAGFDRYFAANRLRVSGTYFYTRLREVIGFDFSGLINPATDPYGRFSGYRNTGGGLARGVELSAEATPHRRLRLQGSYTYTNADERVSTLLGGSLRTIRISDHMVTALATARLWRGLELTGDFMAASGYLFPLFSGGSRPFQFPGPRKADVALSYRKPLGERRYLEFYTRIDNILNQTYYEDAFRTPKAWAVAGLKFGL